MESTSRKKLRLQQVEGTRITVICKPENFRSCLQYKPTENDIFIATYPKCGTTWMQTVVALILRQGKPLCHPLEVHVMCPFIDKYGAQSVLSTSPPRAIKTHLPFNKVPFSPLAKYIYVARNPKDCCVSFYHHAKMFSTYGFQEGTFDDFFEAFMAGEVEYDDYFDHLLSWYIHRNDPNVFFTTYEAMKKNPRSEVLQVAKFIGSEYGNILESRPEVLDRVLCYSSFQYMSGRWQAALDKLSTLVVKDTLDDPAVLAGLKPELEKLATQIPDTCEENMTSPGFIRKGVVGDWKNYFSPEQSARIERKFLEKMQGTDAVNLWEIFS